MISPSTHRTLYIAGPVSGRPKGNRAAFGAAAMRLRHQGFVVVSPSELGLLPSMPWATCMRRCLAELLRCDAVAVLHGWRTSPGASLETYVAGVLGMPVVDAERLRLVTYDLALEGI